MFLGMIFLSFSIELTVESDSFYNTSEQLVIDYNVEKMEGEERSIDKSTQQGKE